MPFTRRLATFALASALLVAPCRALATPCDAAATIARVHDRYHAILNEDDPIRARSAAQLHAMIPDLNAIFLATTLAGGAADIDAERLNRVFQAAHRLSRDLITGLTPTMVGLAPHLENVDWLARTVADTGCTDRFAAAGTADAAPAAPRRAAAPRPESGDQDTVDPVPPLALGLLALIGLVAVIRKSRAFRIMQVERLPRHVTTVAVDISFETPDTGPRTMRVTGLDLSAGGMKLAWQGALPRGTTVTLRLPVGLKTGSVVWSNAYYAGILFDQHLGQDELRRLLA